MLQGGMMGMQTKERLCRAEGVNPHNLGYCQNTGTVARIFALAVAEAEWICWGSEGAGRNWPAVTLAASGKHCPPCAALLQWQWPCPCLDRQLLPGSPSTLQPCASTRPGNNPDSFSLQAEVLPPSLGSVAKPGGFLVV